MAKLEYERLVGYTGSPLAVLGNEVLFCEGNNVMRVNGETGILESQSDMGKPIGPLAVCTRQSIIVVGLIGEEVELRVCNMTFKMTQQIKDVGQLEVLDMAFSRDGSTFAVVCGQLSFKISIFSVDGGAKTLTPICSTQGGSQQPRTIAFSPFSWEELASVGNHHVLFWRVERSQGSPALIFTEGRTQHQVKVSSLAHSTRNGVVLCGTTGGDVYEFDANTGAGTPWWETPGGATGGIVSILLTRHHVVTASQDGILRFFRHDSHAIERTLTLASSRVSSVVAAPSWNAFYVGGRDGVLQVVRFESYEGPSLKADAFREVSDSGRVLLSCSGGGLKKAVCFTKADSDYLVMIGCDSTLRVYSPKDNTLVSKVDSGSGPTSLCAGTGVSSGYVVVGYDNSHVRLFNLARLASPVLLEQAKLTDKENVVISAISMCPFGRRFACVADGVGVFFSTQFTSLHFIGHISFESPIRALSWADNSSILASSDSGDIRYIVFPSENEPYEDPDTKEFPKSLVAYVWRTDLPVDHIRTLDSQEELVTVCVACRDKSIRLYNLDLSVRNPDPTKVALKKPHMQWAPCDKAVSNVVVTENFVISSSLDGRMEIRDLNGKMGDKPLVSACRHNCLFGGVADFELSSDKKRVFSIGGDGLLGVWVMSGARDTSQKPYVIGPMEVDPDAATPSIEEHTYISKADEERSKALQAKYEWHRKEVGARIATLRDQLQHYKTENVAAAEDEKLETQAFMIESQRQEIQEEGRKLMAEKEEEIKWTNLAKEHIADRIKKQCWDSMSQHLKVLKGMQEKTQIEVPSYVIEKHTNEQRVLLRKMKFMREVEMMEWSRRSNIETLDNLQATEEEEAQENGEEPAEAAAPPPPVEEEAEKEEALTLEEESLLPVEALLYNKYSTYTKARTITQIALLGQEIFVRRDGFNRHVASQLERKKTDIERIMEKNVKIKQIFKELDLPEQLTVAKEIETEHPDRVLTVTDTEININKLSDAKAEADDGPKKRSEEDETNERALKIMMDNRLERDERVVVEIKVPPFADESNKEQYRPREEWGDEEQKAYKEYEKRVQKRLEEEEKHRRSLHAELKEVQKEVDKILADYDTELLNLFNLKLNTDTELCQMDLQIIKLAQGRVQQDEMSSHVSRLQKVVERAKEEAAKATQLAHESFKELQLKRDKLDELVANEKRKTGDKEIRTQHPFADNEDYADMLIKILRKSTKPKKDKQKKEPREDKRRKDDTFTPDPFAFVEEEEEERKKKATVQPDASEVRMEKPEGLRDDAWRDFLEFRRERLEAERLQKQLTDEQQELQKVHDRLSKESRTHQADLEEKSRILHEFKRQMVRECYNLDTMHTFKQGKIEVEQEAVVTDYADAILIDKQRIEELNVQIREHGRAKVEKMMEIMQFKKGICYIEWENQMLRHEVRSLEMEHKHLHTLRATKAMQEFIKGGAENHHDLEREGIMKKIEHVKTAMQSKIDEKKAQMQKIRIIIREKDAENELLAEQVKEARQLVAQRDEIHHLQSTGLDQQRNLRLMKDMRVTRKLEDVARAQQEEMKLLKKEIDRLRERTFPSFAVVSKRVVGNPDEVQ